MDGANMNGQCGLTSPGTIGADACHLNLHKTFAMPHGGGGPGVGPICVAKHLVEFLPTHSVVKTGGEHGIHAVSAAPYGSVGMLPVTYGYLLMLGAEGYAISSYASDAEKQAAYDFIKFFATADSEYKFWQSSGKIPAVKAGQDVDFITGQDYEGFLQQIADGCRPTLTFAGIAGLKGALGDAYSAVFSGEMTNEQAVNALVADLAELMEDYN